MSSDGWRNCEEHSSWKRDKINLRNTGTAVSTMFGFHIDSDKGTYTHELYYEHNGEKFQCPSALISNLLNDEYEFRVYSQDKQARLDYPETENRFGSDEENGWSQLPTKNKSIFLQPEPVIARCVESESNLYYSEAALPGIPLKELYDAVREDEKWYLRDELVKDCTRRGGCCGKGCDCCEGRLEDPARKGLSGHCTLGCACCQERNDFYPTILALDQSIARERKALESHNPHHLLRMADAYFRNPSYLPSSQQQQQLQLQPQLVSASTDWAVSPTTSVSSEPVDSWGSGSTVTITEDRVSIEEEDVEGEISASGMPLNEGEEKSGLWSWFSSGRK